MASGASGSMIDDSLDIRIERFSSLNEAQSLWMCETHKTNGDLVFSASASPNGIGKRNAGFVSVKVNEIRRSKSLLSHSRDILTWTVSVVDAEGQLRFPISFSRTPCKEDESLADLQLVDFIGEKYLERIFLLRRADELLPDDTLTLRLQISYVINKKSRKKQRGDKLKRSLSAGDFPSLDFYQQTSWHDFVPITKEITAVKKRGGDLADDPQSPVYDHLFSIKFSHLAVEVSHSPLSCGDHHWTADDSRENCGCVLIPSIMPFDVNRPKPRYRGVEYILEENYTDFAENDWLFQTNPDKYLLSMDPDSESFGSKLMRASPVIRRIVATPMTEMRQKCIKLRTIASQSFFNLLFYLENGILFFETFSHAFELYQVAHMYQMEELLRTSADCMAKSFTPVIIDDVKKVAEFYSDDHLSKLVEEYFNTFQNSLPVPRQEINSGPSFDRYVN